jgi:hypothetical protein
LLALLVARDIHCQAGIEQAFTDRLYEIQWIDFAHSRFLRTL